MLQHFIIGFRTVAGCGKTRKLSLRATEGSEDPASPGEAGAGPPLSEGRLALTKSDFFCTLLETAPPFSSGEERSASHRSVPMAAGRNRPNRGNGTLIDNHPEIPSLFLIINSLRPNTRCPRRTNPFSGEPTNAAERGRGVRPNRPSDAEAPDRVVL
jgi:hypothetical protein